MALESLGLFGLLIASFLAATILPFSSEVLLFYLLKTGYDPITCLLVATLGNGIGGTTNYYLGKLGNPLWMKRLGVNEKVIARNQRYAERYGALLAFFSWVPLIGDPLVVALGYLRSPARATLAWLWLGKFLRYALILWLA